MSLAFRVLLFDAIIGPQDQDAIDKAIKDANKIVTSYELVAQHHLEDIKQMYLAESEYVSKYHARDATFAGVLADKRSKVIKMEAAIELLKEACKL